MPVPKQPSNNQPSQAEQATAELSAAASRLFKTPDGTLLARYFMAQLVSKSYHPYRANEIGIVAYQEGIRKICHEVLTLGKVIDLKELTRVGSATEPTISDFREPERQE